MKTIFHIDINSYFATILQQENPNLRGKPVGVIKDTGRTCIIAASKEAKKKGIKTGSLVSEAKQLCPDIICLPAQFDRFLDATRRLKEIFESFAPNVYIYSLDEAFVDVSDCLTFLYKNPFEVAKNIQQKIKDGLGEWVTANIGISHNRLLSKIASEIAPKGEILVINNQNKDQILASVGFEDVCGIGFALTRKLKLMNITVPYQLRLLPVKTLEPFFGPFWSKELKKIAWGEEPHLLKLLDRNQPFMKSVGRSITGYRLCDNERQIKSILLNLIEEVCLKARKMKLAGRQVSISLQGENRKWKAHKTLKHHLSHTSGMFEIAYNRLYKNWRRSFKIIRFAVRLGLLCPINKLARPILPEYQKEEAVYKAMDNINEKYGLFTVRSGALLNQEIIKPEVTGFLGDKIYYSL